MLKKPRDKSNQGDPQRLLRFRPAPVGRHRTKLVTPWLKPPRGQFRSQMLAIQLRTIKRLERKLLKHITSIESIKR